MPLKITKRPKRQICQHFTLGKNKSKFGIYPCEIQCAAEAPIIPPPTINRSYLNYGHRLIKDRSTEETKQFAELIKVHGSLMGILFNNPL